MKMNKACQVQVINEGSGNSKRMISLYNGEEGSPSDIIPAIRETFWYQREKHYDDEPVEDTFEWSRKTHAGMVACYLCSTSPGHFEPLDNHDLNPYIDFHYLLYCGKNRDGDTGAWKTVWELEVFAPTKRSFVTQDMRMIQPRTRLEDIDIEEVERNKTLVMRETHGFDLDVDVAAIKRREGGGVTCFSCSTDSSYFTFSATDVITYEKLEEYDLAYLCEDCGERIPPYGDSDETE
jgi:hypothetical protein